MSTPTAVVLGIVLAVVPGFAATSPAGRCAGSKLKATAVAARALARCHSDAAKSGVFLSSACVDAAFDRFATRFAISEATGECATSDDEAAVRSIVEFAMNDVVALVRPGLPADVCASLKLRTVGSELFAILSAHAAAVRGADPARLTAAIGRAEARLSAAFDHIEQVTTCGNPATAASVEALLDSPIARLRGKLAPSCGDDVLAGSEACDGADSSACPGRCLADCSCRPIVCGDGLREGTEVCDGSDDAACPGQCRADCRCPGTCGDGVVDGTEQCDGAASAACGTFACQAPGLLGECQCCSAGYCSGGFPNVCCGSDVRCVRNAQSPVGVCTPYTCSQASDCGIGGYECEDGSCCAQPERSCINIGCCGGSACTFASGVPLCCIPTGSPCTAPHVAGICCGGSCNAGTGVCD